MTHLVRYLDLADFLIITETVLHVDARELAFAAGLDLAESALAAPAAAFEGHEFYPRFEDKAAVLCCRLIRNNPLVDGNKRVGFLCLIEFVERNGYEWTAPPSDGPSGDETVRIIKNVAAGVMDERGLADWISQRITPRG